MLRRYELERSIDALAGQIIARRKPAAGDLRLLLAFIKSTTDLERTRARSRAASTCCSSPSRSSASATTPPTSSST
jgi:hypothetical protein